MLSMPSTLSTLSTPGWTAAIDPTPGWTAAIDPTPGWTAAIDPEGMPTAPAAYSYTTYVWT